MTMKQDLAQYQSSRAWLYRLDGEDVKSPLLSPWERQLVEDVCYEIKREADSKNFPPFEDEGDILQKISIIEDNLKIIARELKTNKRSRKQFVLKYPEWRKIRQESIETLEQIGNSVHEDRKKCNISRLVGNCTSFVGGGVCIASAALIPFTVGLSTPLAVVGGMTTVLGSATSIGTSVTELKLLKKKIQKASTVLEKDRTAFEDLKDWLTSASDLSKAVDSILAIDVDKNIEYVLQAIQKFVVMVKSTHDKLRQNIIIKDLVQMLFNNLPSKFVLMTVLPCLIGLLLVLALLFTKESFSDNKPWEKMANSFSSIVNVSFGILGPAAATFIKSDAIIAQSVAKAVAVRGVVAVVGMSLDAASIILTSIDVHKGSVSAEGLKITEAADKMKEESDLLDRVYREMLEL